MATSDGKKKTSRVTGFKVDEVSAVDRAANRRNAFLIQKSAGVTDITKALDKGAILGAIKAAVDSAAKVVELIATVPDDGVLTDEQKAQVTAAMEAAATASDALAAVKAHYAAMLGISQADDTQMAEWDTAYVNDLPDSAFLHVEAGGEKDDQGKTVPRTLRHFPVRNADGNLDLPHLRNALARIPQSSVSDAAKEKATAEATKLLEAETKSDKAEGSTSETMFREWLTGIVAACTAIGEKAGAWDAATLKTAMDALRDNMWRWPSDYMSGKELQEAVAKRDSAKTDSEKWAADIGVVAAVAGAAVEKIGKKMAKVRFEKLAKTIEDLLALKAELADDVESEDKSGEAGNKGKEAETMNETTLAEKIAASVGEAIKAGLAAVQKSADEAKAAAAEMQKRVGAVIPAPQSVAPGAPSVDVAKRSPVDLSGHRDRLRAKHGPAWSEHLNDAQ